MSKRSQNNRSGSVISHVVPSSIMGPRLVLLVTVLALLLLGLVMVYSASSIEAIDKGVSTTHYVMRQLTFAGVGLAGGFVLWKLIPYHWWSGPFVWIAWLVMVVLLILTAAIGTKTLGAQRWLYIGSFGLQPSEFAKIVFVIMGARIMFELRTGELAPNRALLEAFVLIGLPLFFIFGTQSDLGTTLICLIGILVVLWLGEVPIRIFLGLISFAVVFAVASSFFGYRKDRLIFLDPWQDYYDSGFQLIHSFYAFAEGGLLGSGLGNSREKFLYLPEAETDFIFAIIGEELGLIGALIVILLFIVFLWAGLRITRTAADDFGAMIAGGLTVMIVFQAFLNMGCVIGVLPTTGKPLPFISSGGSSLIACLFMVGIILSVSQGSDQPSVYEQRRGNLKVVKPRSGESSSRNNYRSSRTSYNNLVQVNPRGHRQTRRR